MNTSIRRETTAGGAFGRMRWSTRAMVVVSLSLGLLTGMPERASAHFSDHRHQTSVIWRSAPHPRRMEWVGPYRSPARFDDVCSSGLNVTATVTYKHSPTKDRVSLCRAHRRWKIFRWTW